MISTAMKIVSRCIGFSDEIKSDKWVNLGLEISVIPKCYSENLKYFFYDIDFVLVQCLFILSESPNQIFRDFLEGYSIDSVLNNIFIQLLLLNEDSIKDIEGNIEKNIACFKNLLYFINQLMIDDRTIMYKWRDQQNFLTYPYKELVKVVSDKYLSKASKYEAIHGLVRLSGTNIKNILNKSNKQMAKSQEFERNLNKFARITENSEKISIFSLDPKYISNFNPFYFNNINQFTEGVKNYEEYYKSKVKKGDETKAQKNNPLRIENSSIGFFLALIKESLIKTDLVKILVKIIKLRKNHKFIDNEIEEFTAHILTMMIDYAVEQEADYADK